jgi:hypothetical protein
MAAIGRQRAAHLKVGAGQKYQNRKSRAGQELCKADTEADKCPHGLTAEVGQDGLAVAVEVGRRGPYRRVGEG